MDKYYIWEKNGDKYCAKVMDGHTAHYYKNGEVFAVYKQWIPQKTDIEITEKEFIELIKD